jgi:hypothetical protein
MSKSFRVHHRGLSAAIRFDYGEGNANLSPTAGLSAGDGLAYQRALSDGQSQLGHRS